MKTSNFSSMAKTRAAGLIPVSIALGTPKWAHVAFAVPVAMPTHDLLMKYKSGQITDEEYKYIYLGILEARREGLLKVFGHYLTAEAESNQEYVLLCWCAKSSCCHRRILAEWLGANLGATIEEF